MAGNVKEWCWNEAGGERIVLGGAWDEPAYMFTNFDAKSPFERSARYGFRTVKYLSEEGVPAASEPILLQARDYTKERPVSDDIFRIFESLYAYDKSDLAARIESIDDREEDWRREKISLAAAYGNERVPVYLFVPKRRSPTIPDRGLFLPRRVIESGSERGKSADGLRRFHHQEWPGRSLPGVQGHVRALWPFALISTPSPLTPTAVG